MQKKIFIILFFIIICLPSVAMFKCGKTSGSGFPGIKERWAYKWRLFFGINGFFRR